MIISHKMAFHTHALELPLTRTKVNLQIVTADSVFRPFLWRYSRKIMRYHVTRSIMGRPEGILHVSAILNLSVFPVHDQWNIIKRCYTNGKVFLTINKRLKRIAQIDKRQARHESMDNAVWSKANIIQPRMHKRFKVLSTNISIPMGSPCDCQRMHVIFCLKDMSHVTTIFTTATRHNYIKAAILSSVSVA